jgi:prevent-host-death family protein
MSRSYSVYEAKAKLSELLRQVKKGKHLVVTERGIPIAKVVPYAEDESISDRIDDLKSAGMIGEAKGGWKNLKGVSRPGGLNRFLESRD